MKWIKNWWLWVVAVLAIALVIRWEEERCQSQTHQCTAAYIAQLPSSGLTVEQRIAAQQAITAACEPEGYFCRLLSPANLASVLLVLIGIPGIYAAVRTLRSIERQTIESVKATKAMERNTEAFVHSQRPIIACDPHKDSGAGWHPILDIIDSARMRLDLFNRGQTSAFRCHSETWIELVPHAPNASFSTLEDFTFTDNAVHFAPTHPFSIYPNHGPVVINIPIGRDLSAAEHVAMRSARLVVCVRLRVTYRDVFLTTGDPDRFADFGFWVMFEGLGPLSKYQDSN